MARHTVRSPKAGRYRALKYIGIGTAAFAVVFVVYSYWLVASTLDGIKGPPVTNLAGEVVEEPLALPAGPRTILVLGTDARVDEDPETGTRTDTMIIMKADPDKKMLSMLSIPRDTWVDVPGKWSMKINGAYVYGLGPLAVEAVEQVSNVDIDYYMVVDWTAFRQFIDTIGPVHICVPNDLYDPIHEFRLEEGCQDLNGFESLQYVRFRHDARGDLGRIERQQDFVKQMAGQVSSLGLITKAPKLMSIVKDNVITDMPGGELLALGNLLRQVPQDKIVAYEAPGALGRRSGQSVILIDEEEMAATVAEFQGLEPPVEAPEDSSAGFDGDDT